MRLATAVVAVVAGAVGLFYGLVPTRIERFLDHDFHPGRIEARAGAVLKAAGFAAESSPVTKLLAPENRLLAAVDAVYALEREPPPPHAPLWSYKLRWLDRDRRRIAQVRLTLDGRLIGLEVASLEGRESAGSFADPREVALHFLQRVGEPDAAQFVARAQVERAGGGAIQFLDRRRRDRLDWSRSVTVSGNRVTGYEFTLAPIGAPALEERTGYTAARNLSLGLFVIKQIFFVFAILFLLHTFRRQELSTRPGLALALMAGGANLLGLIVSSPFSFELRWQDQSLPLIGRILTSPNVALQTLVMMGLQAISLGLIVFAVATAGTHADAGGKGALTQELSSVLHRTYPSRRKLIGRIGEALAWGVGLTALTGLFAHLQPLIADATFLPQIVSSSFVLNASHPASALGSMALGDIAMVPAPFLKRPRGIRDVAEWYMSIALRPDYIEQVFDRQTALALENLVALHAAVKDPIDVAYVCGTDFGTQTSTFCSRDTFRRLYLPYYRRMTDWIHAHTTWKVLKHSCGAVVSLLPDFLDAGIDVLNPVQCSATGMDPRHLKDTYGDRLTFWGGGVDTQQVLPYGTPADVREQVLRRCEIFAERGGFVFNAIHNVQARTPVANIVAMIDAVHAFNGDGRGTSA